MKDKILQILYSQYGINFDGNLFIVVRLEENELQTFGRVYHSEAGLISYVQELPWRGNRVQVSRISAGDYQVYRWHSPTFRRDVVRFAHVPGRTNILGHAGNFVDNPVAGVKGNTTGCQLYGLSIRDINNDRVLDLKSSVSALEKIMKLMPDRKIKVGMKIIDMFGVEPAFIGELKA